MMQELLQPSTAALLLLMGFFAITFLQSAFDKVVDRKGNLEFLQGHFKSSPLANQVPTLFSILTLVEFISGLACTYAIFTLIVGSEKDAVSFALAICGSNLLMLLLGQRLAKDYAGASTLGIYMILVMTGFLILIL